MADKTIKVLVLTTTQQLMISEVQEVAAPGESGPLLRVRDNRALEGRPAGSRTPWETAAGW